MKLISCLNKRGCIEAGVDSILFINNNWFNLFFLFIMNGFTSKGDLTFGTKKVFCADGVCRMLCGQMGFEKMCETYTCDET